ncbi:hypothetical protein [Clostridium sardiniense]|uniref:hypothetical protein n=1 Tax=Clostridium sardiniense TaxID=29369 RepID=UPI003D34FAAF
MKYLAIIILLLIITFVSMFVFSFGLNKGNGLKSNLKVTGMMMIVTLPIISLVGGTLFLAFKLVETVLPVQIETFDIFTISIIGVFIIFICDLISKKIIGGVMPIILAKKYEGKELKEKEMMDIINGLQKKVNLLTLGIMFLSSLILYMGLMTLISVEFTGFFLIIISLLTLVSYRIFFRGKGIVENQ